MANDLAAGEGLFSRSRSPCARLWRVPAPAVDLIFIRMALVARLDKIECA
jgi:hypothetical protein